MICTLRFTIVALLALFAVRAAEAAPRPNIILILVDDMGWGDLSCFGNTEAETPHLDRLAAEGIRFSQFYVAAPICSPSRCALVTGQYPQRWKITSFLNNREDNRRRGVADWLDVQAPSLARLLQSAGYATGHFGKWHLGGQRDVGDAPLITEYGFDESLTNFEGLGPRLLGLADAHDGKPLKRHALGSDLLGHGPVIWYDRSQLTAGYVGAATAFLDRAAAAGQPCYVNIWPDDVHSPYYPPEARRGEGKRALYHGVLETMDEQLGALFDHVRKSPKLRDNTLIVFCSDNGHEPGAGTAGPLRGAKTTLYEGGVRSPLIVWGPGLMARGVAGRHDAKSVFAAMDLAPSLLAIAGVSAPNEIAFDGEELSATLLGRRAASRTAPIFWRRPPDRKSWTAQGLGPQPDLAVRSGPWKLLCNYDGSEAELYHVVSDPGEQTNVAAREPVEVQRLTKLASAWHREMPADAGPTLAAEKVK